MKGNALLCVQASQGIMSYNALIHLLRCEFSAPTNSRKIHEQLSRMRAKPEQSFVELFYTVKKIASAIYIDEDSVTNYIISGLPGSATSKLFLYESQNLSELKDRIMTYAY